MNLFGETEIFPEGFVYHPNFISEDEERTLIGFIERYALVPFVFHGYEAKRKVKSFGYHYHFDKRKLSKGDPIPEQFDFLLTRVAVQLQVPPHKLVELLLTEYPQGSVINWHRDAFPFEHIAGISLNADCIFKLRPYDQAKDPRRRPVSFSVKRRSLYIVRDSARYHWEHSIEPVLNTRYSITIRTLKQDVAPT